MKPDVCEMSTKCHREPTTVMVGNRNVRLSCGQCCYAFREGQENPTTTFYHLSTEEGVLYQNEKKLESIKGGTVTVMVAPGHSIRGTLTHHEGTLWEISVLNFGFDLEDVSTVKIGHTDSLVFLYGHNIPLEDLES